MPNWSPISTIINSQAKAFELFLRTQIFDDESWKIIQDITKASELYIFSGIIRDFLTGDYNGFRDIDLVLAENKYFNRFIKILLKNDIVSLDFNQFGGIKITFNNLHIDVWKIEDTWGIKNEKKEATADSLVDSAFFNFQAIVYSIHQHRFIFHDDFCRFLEMRVMDVVYDKNPNEALCVVNVCHYWTLYNYGISRKLTLWLKKHYKKNKDLLLVQQRHFGRILYSIEYIDKFIKNLFAQL